MQPRTTLQLPDPVAEASRSAPTSFLTIALRFRRKEATSISNVASRGKCQLANANHFERRTEVASALPISAVRMFEHIALCVGLCVDDFTRPAAGFNQYWERAPTLGLKHQEAGDEVIEGWTAT